MNIEQARRELGQALAYLAASNPNARSFVQDDALSTLYALAIERDEALRQAQAEHEKLETLRNILKEKNQ